MAEINNWYFTSTRAISTYTNSKNETALIAGGLNADEGAFLAVSNNPSAGQDTFTEILGKAEFDSLGVTPACKRGDVNGERGFHAVVRILVNAAVAAANEHAADAVDVYEARTEQDALSSLFLAISSSRTRR